MPALSTIAALAPSAIGLGSLAFGGGKGKPVEYTNLQSPEQQKLQGFLSNYLMQKLQQPWQPNPLSMGAANMASQHYLGQPYQHPGQAQMGQMPMGGQYPSMNALGGMGGYGMGMPQFQVGGQMPGGTMPGGGMPRRTIQKTNPRRGIPAV